MFFFCLAYVAGLICSFLDLCLFGMGLGAASSAGAMFGWVHSVGLSCMQFTCRFCCHGL